MGETKVLVVNLAREASKVVAKVALAEAKVVLAEAKVVLVEAKAASAVVRVVSGAKRDLAEMAELESDLSYSNRANPIALLGAMGFFL